MLELILPKKTEKEKPPMPEGAEAYARSVLQQQLADSADLCIIASTLSSIELRHQAKPLCRLMDRDLKDAQRILAKAKAIVRSVDPDTEANAVEEAAMRICNGVDHEYAAFESQSPRIQAHYRKLAEHAINGYWNALEGE